MHTCVSEGYGQEVRARPLQSPARLWTSEEAARHPWIPLHGKSLPNPGGAGRKVEEPTHLLQGAGLSDSSRETHCLLPAINRCFFFFFETTIREEKKPTSIENLLCAGTLPYVGSLNRRCSA